MSSSNTTGLRGMLVQLLQEGIIYSREAPRNLPKSQVYFDSVNEMDTIEFRSQFRVSRGGFNKILKRLTAVGFSDSEHTTALTNKQRLMIALWYFGNPEGYRAISQRFGVAMSTAHGCVQEVTRFLGKLQSTVVSISPDLEDTVQRLSRYGFPGVIRAIDGTHVRVLPAALHKADYLNRHGIACIHLTAVCSRTLAE